MDKIFNRPAISITVLFVLCVYLFGLQLGGLALTDPDETFYAQTAKEMLAKDEWITPHLYGKPQFEKPILFYWLVEASFRVFGVSEFAARLPSAVFGFIGVVAMYLLGSLLFSRRAGFLSAAALAANVEYIILSRACVTDMVLATFMLIGFLFFFYGQIRDKTGWYLFSSAAFALATLTKGPVAILLAGAIIVPYFFITGEWRKARPAALLWSVAVFAAVSLPWYLAAYKAHGKAFLDAFFGFQNITRFTVSEHKIGSQFYYNIPIVLGGLFPWSIFLGAGFWYAFKNAFSRDDSRKRKNLIFILLWFFVIFIFFSISSTKLPTYVFPSFAALALIVGLVWDEFLGNSAAAPIRRWMFGSYYFLLVAIAAGLIGLYLGLKEHYPNLLAASAVPALFLGAGLLSSYIALVKGKHPGAFFLIVFSVMVFLGLFGASMIPEIEKLETSKEIALKLKGMMGPDEAIGSESNYRAGVTFYTGKFASDLDKHENLVRFLMQDEKRVWAVLKDKNHRELYELDTKPFCTKPSYMVYKLGKRGIVTNMAPDDGVYITRRERK
jgi:hypothetical protein